MRTRLPNSKFGGDKNLIWSRFLAEQNKFCQPSAVPYEKCPLKAACYFRFLWEWYLAGIWRIAARTPTLPSSFYYGALSFDSYGTQSYVLKQKGPKCVILKPQTSLQSESFLALFDPDASRLLTRSCHLQFIAYANLFRVISQQ